MAQDAATPGLSGAGAHCSDCTHTKAYDAAEVYGTNPNRGVVLHLHDCRGLNIDKGWQREWLDYLKLNGFVVIAIDSFADVRPQPLACKKDQWRYLFTKAVTYSVRKQQAEYAVKKIREKYPGQRIFVWGHGEGGVTAQLVGEEIDGVISTGASCSTEWLDEKPPKRLYLSFRGPTTRACRTSRRAPCIKPHSRSSSSPLLVPHDP